MRLLHATRFVLPAMLTALLAGPADAALVTTNSTLSDGVYFGTGNVDGGWTVATGGGYEIALRAKVYNGAVITPDYSGSAYTNVYTASTGLYPSPTRALWSWEYSIYNTVPGGNLSGLTANLSVTDGPTSGGPYNLLAVADNAHSGDGQGVQNSENMVFGFLPGFNPWDGKTYTFTLNLTDGTTTIVSDTIDVNAVPEPASLLLLGSGLVGLIGRRRRRA